MMTTASIIHLDVLLQSVVSQFLDIDEWQHLVQTSKCFRSWPQPPPPVIDYHIIQFCLSSYSPYSPPRRNQNSVQPGSTYFGLAKSLNGVLDAFKFMNAKHKAARQYEIEKVSYKFLHIEELVRRNRKGEREPHNSRHAFDLWDGIIPIVQYREKFWERENIYEYSNIHQIGRDRYGVKELGEKYPDLLRSSMKWRIKDEDNFNLWVIGPDEVADPHQCYKGIFFDDEGRIPTFAWFDGMRPSINIDLRNLMLRSSQIRDPYEGRVLTYSLCIE